VIRSPIQSLHHQGKGRKNKGVFTGGRRPIGQATDRGIRVGRRVSMIKQFGGSTSKRSNLKHLIPKNRRGGPVSKGGNGGKNKKKQHHEGRFWLILGHGAGEPNCGIMKTPNAAQTKRVSGSGFGEKSGQLKKKVKANGTKKGVRKQKNIVRENHQHESGVKKRNFQTILGSSEKKKKARGLDWGLGVKSPHRIGKVDHTRGGKASSNTGSFIKEKEKRLLKRWA